jgi:hypothetical protein
VLRAKKDFEADVRTLEEGIGGCNTLAKAAGMVGDQADFLAVEPREIVGNENIRAGSSRHAMPPRFVTDGPVASGWLAFQGDRGSKWCQRSRESVRARTQPSFAFPQLWSFWLRVMMENT